MNNAKNLGIVCLFLLILVLLPSTLSSDPDIGYEIITHEGKNYLHVWNQGNIEPNYYYENNCLSQVSNILGEQWEIVTKYIGTYQNDQFLMYEWDSQNNCTRTDTTDNQTYVNNSAITVIETNNKEINLGMNSHLETNDDQITQIYSFDAPVQTNFDVWFLLKSHDIQVAGDSDNDYLKVKRTNGIEELYELNNSNEIWLDSEDYLPFYFIYDNVENKNILSQWNNNNYNWKIKIDGNVSLYVNLGNLDGNTKYFEKQWVDAGCTCTGISEITSDINWPEGNETDVGNNLTMSCRFDITQGFGTCSGCAGLYRDDQMGSWRNIPTSANSTDILECDAIGQCGEKDILYNGTWYDKTITCNSNGTVGTTCIHEDVGGVNEVSSGTRYVVCNPALSESEAREAIEEGINLILSEDIYTDKKIHLRYVDGSQDLGSFDKLVSDDNQTWVFNYISDGESSTNINSLNTWMHVWENSSLNYSQVVDQVSNFINESLV